MAASRRRFGQIRKLPSGKFQASFALPNGGKRQNAPGTFVTKTDARAWLTKVEADLSRGTWLNDELGQQPFGTYARAWLRDNTKIGPRYRETCTRNQRLHMTALENIPLRALTPPVIREWYAAEMRGKGGRTSIQQSYRFLHAVLATAVRDACLPLTLPISPALAPIGLKNARSPLSPRWSRSSRQSRPGIAPPSCSAHGAVFGVARSSH